MINRIKYLQEELSRHNPESYLETEMEVRMRGSKLVIEPAGATVEELDAKQRVDELAKMAEEIHISIKDDEYTLESLKVKIKAILVQYEAI